MIIINMNMQDFIYALFGGILIGGSASLMLFVHGKIVGISGIISEVLTKIKVQHYWRYAFLLGLALGSWGIYIISPRFFQYNIPLSWTDAIVGGLFVGFGTKLGTGCTSGHGICGIARFSLRSIVATVIFISFAIITANLRTKVF